MLVARGLNAFSKNFRVWLRHAQGRVAFYFFILHAATKTNPLLSEHHVRYRAIERGYQALGVWRFGVTPG